MEPEDDIEAIQAGIDDMEAGQVVPFEQVDARLRAKLGIEDDWPAIKEALDGMENGRTSP